MTKPPHILIGYDASRGAASALDDLHRAGLPDGTCATVLTVADIVIPSGESFSSTSPLATQLPSVAEQMIEEARAIAYDGNRRLKAQHPTWQLQAEVCLGSPATEIIRKAAEWQVDLVVVGCGRKSAWGRFLQGSVSQSVVSHALCSVRVGRARPSPSGWPLRIAVGVDSLAGAAGAMQTLNDREWPSGSEILIVAAVSRGQEVSRSDSTLEAKRRLVSDGCSVLQLHSTVETMANTLSKKGTTVGTVYKEGDPKQVILDAAQQWNADVLVVSDLSGIRQTRLSRIVAWIAVNAFCSVEVIRRF